MRDALFLAGQDLKYMFRAKETLLWTFLMPPIFFFFIGSVTGGGRMMPGTGDTIVLEADGGGWLNDELERKLVARGFRVEKPGSEPGTRTLRTPPEFTEKVLSGKPAKVKLIRRGEGLGSDYDKLRAQLAVYGLLADLVVTTRDGGVATPEAFARLREKPRPLTLKTESAGRRKQIPSGFQQAVPGTMVMFTLLVLFTSGAVSITIERSEGILRRLASSPMSRASAVLGKWGSRWVLGLIQIAFAMAVGKVAFSVKWGDSWLAIILLMLAYAALAASLGMLLGNFGRTTGQVIGIGVVSTNVMAALGGCWWPIEITPLWAQRMALLFPTGWAMDALHRLMMFGEPGTSIAAHLAAMVAGALLAGWAVARRFRFQ